MKAFIPALSHLYPLRALEIGLVFSFNLSVTYSTSRKSYFQKLLALRFLSTTSKSNLPICLHPFLVFSFLSKTSLPRTQCSKSELTQNKVSVAPGCKGNQSQLLVKTKPYRQKLVEKKKKRWRHTLSFLDVGGGNEGSFYFNKCVLQQGLGWNWGANGENSAKL